MKRVLIVLLALALLLGCLMGCAKKEDKPAARTFTVGFDAEFPPFGFIADNGSYDGFDLAVAEEVCKRLGWTFKAQPINWDAKDNELASGNIALLEIIIRRIQYICVAHIEFMHLISAISQLS